ncbi:MAG: hypothetical protein RL136_2297 [Planctomycetota bacterium]
MPHRLLSHAIICLLWCVMVAFVARAEAQTTGRSLGEAAGAFNAKDYPRAAALARLVGDRSTGVERDAARYLEGIALYKAEMLEVAAAPLRHAAQSTDRFIASQANITLGSLEIDRKRFDAAGHAYRRAGELLDGAEARRANSYAARCFDAAGLGVLADRARAANGEGAVGSTTVPALRERPDGMVEPAASDRRVVTIDDKPALDPPVNNIAARRNSPASSASTTPTPTATAPRFAVQVGVFSSVERANKVASDLRIRCTSLDLECPRIVPRQTADGGTLHVVQIGCFPNRGLANKVLLQFPRSGYRVEAYCEAAASPRGGE